MYFSCLSALLLAQPIFASPAANVAEIEKRGLEGKLTTNCLTDGGTNKCDDGFTCFGTLGLSVCIPNLVNTTKFDDCYYPSTHSDPPPSFDKCLLESIQL